MTNLRLGFKIYDNDWFLKYALTPDQAADRLAGLGATYVIAQSRFLPMQDSAVESQVREADGRYEALDDLAFRNATLDFLAIGARLEGVSLPSLGDLVDLVGGADLESALPDSLQSFVPHPLTIIAHVFR